MDSPADPAFLWLLGLCLTATPLSFTQAEKRAKKEAKKAKKKKSKVPSSAQPLMALILIHSLVRT